MPTPIAHTAIRMLRLLAGVLVILAGILLLVLPGPGLLVIIAGLALLGVKMKWIDRLIDRMRHRKDPPSPKPRSDCSGSDSEHP